LNTLLALVALGGSVMFTFRAGQHLPSTWVFSSVLISRPMYSMPCLGKVLDLIPYFMPKCVWQIRQNEKAASQGWPWAILFVISVWSLLIAYYIVIGVLTNVVAGLTARSFRVVKRGLCRCCLLR
jgi:hypothetical protein